MKTTREILIENIRKLRKARGLSQAALAERIGVSERTIQKYEQGTREPDANTIGAIASAAGVTAGSLFDADLDAEFELFSFADAIDLLRAFLIAPTEVRVAIRSLLSLNKKDISQVAPQVDQAHSKSKPKAP